MSCHIGLSFFFFFFFFNDTATTEIYTLSLHDALPIFKATSYMAVGFYVAKYVNKKSDMDLAANVFSHIEDRKSGSAGMPRPISYAVFCLKKKTTGAHTAHRHD